MRILHNSARLLLKEEKTARKGSSREGLKCVRLEGDESKIKHLSMIVQGEEKKEAMQSQAVRRHMSEWVEYLFGARTESLRFEKEGRQHRRN